MSTSEPARTPSSHPNPAESTSDRLSKIWRQAYAARSKEDLSKLYATWSESYDEDHEAIGFFAHRRTAEVFARYMPCREVAAVLDAGAGTGAAGEALATLGYRNISAVDLSTEMLERAATKGVYRDLRVVDLDQPLDEFPCNTFDGAVLVGVFSYGQAPAHALDEIVRVVRPGGVVAFTMRVDFHEEDAMGVRSKVEELQRDHAWKPLEVTDPEQYLPKKDPDAMFRVWCFRVLDTKTPPVDENFAEAVREALSTTGRVKRIDHSHIWNTMASRLYDRYTECPGYYLTDCEIEILEAHAAEILGDQRLVVELGCGSARKIGALLHAATQRESGPGLTYSPIDVSQGALDATEAQLAERFGGAVEVRTRLGRFEDILATIPGDDEKLILFFGGSIGNLEDLETSVEFLRTIRQRMGPKDRFVVGMDLDKDEEVLRGAYEAGPANRSFFLNMLRRINNELGGNLDLGCFVQHSPYELEPAYQGLQTRCVHLRLRNTRTQNVYLASMHMEIELEEGDAIQVGTSRKFKTDQIDRLAQLGGMRIARRWFDERKYFSLNEFVRDDA